MSDIKNYLRWAVEKFLTRKPTSRKADIYNKIPGMTRQNFVELMKPDRTVSPHKWGEIRKAMGIGRIVFWKDAMNFHDPEE